MDKAAAVAPRRYAGSPPRGDKPDGRTIRTRSCPAAAGAPHWREPSGVNPISRLHRSEIAVTFQHSCDLLSDRPCKKWRNRISNLIILIGVASLKNEPIRKRLNARCFSNADCAILVGMRVLSG